MLSLKNVYHFKKDSVSEFTVLKEIVWFRFKPKINEQRTKLTSLSSGVCCSLNLTDTFKLEMKVLETFWIRCQRSLKNTGLKCKEITPTKFY